MKSIVICLLCLAYAYANEAVSRDDAYKSYANQDLPNIPVKKPTIQHEKLLKAKPSLNNFLYFNTWRSFKTTHDKTYDSFEEEERRFNIFIENQNKIDAHNAEYNAGRKSFSMGMNKYGDLTHEEFRRIMNGYKRELADPTVRGLEFVVPPNTDVPETVDWRDKGYVTPVKDQGQCGSCWAFSAVGSLEGQHFKQNKTLTSLSEQNLVDCSRSYGNYGCNGGLMDNAFNYIKANKGIDTEESYPYEARDNRCRFKKDDIGATDNGFIDIPSGDEEALTAAIATVGPISVAIDAGHSSFQFYKKGVYHEPSCSPQNLDHGVLAIGYDTSDKGEKYFLVKNSWGTSWGQEGYIWMPRNGRNTCGIATDASYPKV